MNPQFSVTVVEDIKGTKFSFNFSPQIYFSIVRLNIEDIYSSA